MSDLIGVAEVAEILNAPESTVRQWIHTKTGPVKFARIRK